MSSDDRTLDCGIYLGSAEEAVLRVGGEDYTGRPDFSPPCLAALLAAELEPERYGTLLFEALFASRGSGDLLAGYETALSRSRREDRRLSLRLELAPGLPPALHDLAWERLYDPKRRIPLATSRAMSLCRALAAPHSGERPTLARPRILVVLAAPEGLAEYALEPLDREALAAAVEAALSPLAGRAEWEILDPPASPARIDAALGSGSFHVLHVLGHGLLGAREGGLLLEDDSGRAQVVDEEWFGRIFEGCRSLCLVDLIACHSGARAPGEDATSGLARRLIARGIPAVVAMSRAIPLASAGRFTAEFFAHLAVSGRPDEAVNEGRRRLYLEDPKSHDWATPMLFLRLADGRLWERSAGGPGAGGTAGLDGGGHPAGGGDEIPWESLLERIEAGNLLPIIGPGLTRGLLPSPREIAAAWADEFHYPYAGPTRERLPSVAQYMETRMGRHTPHDRLPRVLTGDLLNRLRVEERRSFRGLSLGQVISRLSERLFDGQTEEPHRILARLPLSTYLTTNYDSFLTEALRRAGRPPRREHCLWQQPGDRVGRAYSDLAGTRDEPLVFHLYGHDEAGGEHVLTEDDYLDFLRSISRDDFRIPERLRSDLTDSMLLFLGYRVEALDCRVLFRGLIKPLAQATRGRVALLQLEADEAHGEQATELKRFRSRWCEDVDIRVFWGSVREFLIELHRRWEESHGSLGAG